MFFVLFSNIFLGSSKAILKALFDESESILFKQFFINFNFDFGVLAQKCPKPCVNGVLKFQFFSLNLSSKALAGFIVRTSKYPYMDICDLHSSQRESWLNVEMRNECTIDKLHLVRGTASDKTDKSYNCENWENIFLLTLYT